MTGNGLVGIHEKKEDSIFMSIVVRIKISEEVSFGGTNMVIL